MPLFMDVHRSAQGVTVDDVVAAHLADLQAQARHDTHYVTYWFNQEAGRIFCLVEAPTKDAADAVHREAHGLVADEIIEVQPELVDAMMAVRREQLPNGQTMPETGAPDPGFRTIMFTDLEDSTHRTNELGDQAMFALLQRHDALIQSSLQRHDGREVKHTGDGVMASFVSAAKAVACAITIQQAFDEHNATDPAGAMRVRIGFTSGEPIERESDLFGRVVNLARRACDAAEPGQILTTDVVRDICTDGRFQFDDLGHATLKGFDEPVRLFEVAWQGAVA